MANRTALFSRKQPGGVFTIDDFVEHPGDIYFVDSGSGTDTAGFGKDPDSPFKTIDFAIGQCTADQGDVIYVMPGHAEAVTAAGGLAIDVAGISIRGLGIGDNRPSVTLDTATTADVNIDADDIYISGLRFISAINDLAVILDCNNDNLTVEDCEFSSSSTKECFNFVNLATTKDRFTFRRCQFYQPTDPAGTDGNAATGCFYFVDSELILVEDCSFFGFFETSIFHNKTTKALRLWIKNCQGTQELAAADVITLVDDATGGMARCDFTVTAAADVVEGTFMTLAATTPFGFFDTFFMNDNGGGGNLALAVTAATT